MGTLYLDRKNLSLRLEGKRLVIDEPVYQTQPPAAARSGQCLFVLGLYPAAFRGGAGRLWRWA
ncbi:MAG: hypothetical protein R3F37_00135 [Candidatus Competibacteraceae bacterium]